VSTVASPCPQALVGSSTARAGTPDVSASVSSLVDWTLLVLPGVIWGASFLFIAEGLEAMAPDGVAFVRIAIGFATLSFVPAARRPINPGDRRGTALIGLLWFAFPMCMFPYAEQRVSSALAGMLNGATPLFATAVAALLARQLPSRPILGGLLIGLTGGALIASPSLGQGHNSTSGVLMIVAALVSYGFAFNLARPLQQRSGALPVVWRALGVAVVLTAPLGIPALIHAQWTLSAFLSLLMLGTLGTALATVLVTIASGRIGAARASATTFFTPVVALALGVMARGESVALLSVLGCIVCLLGAWTIRRR
jgi:drug/metabolite transporter (DMT)-like permease